MWSWVLNMSKEAWDGLVFFHGTSQCSTWCSWKRHGCTHWHNSHKLSWSLKRISYNWVASGTCRCTSNNLILCTSENKSENIHGGSIYPSIHLSIYLSIYMRVCVWGVYLHIYTMYFLYVYLYICIRMYVCMYICIYIYICIRMYVCMYVCMYNHTHTYVYIYICINLWRLSPCLQRLQASKTTWPPPDFSGVFLVETSGPWHQAASRPRLMSCMAQ